MKSPTNSRIITIATALIFVITLLSCEKIVDENPSSDCDRENLPIEMIQLQDTAYTAEAGTSVVVNFEVATTSGRYHTFDYISEIEDSKLNYEFTYCDYGEGRGYTDDMQYRTINDTILIDRSEVYDIYVNGIDTGKEILITQK